MKRTIGTILFVIYAIIAILVTVLLLSFNEYNCSEIGGYTVYIVDDDSLEPPANTGPRKSARIIPARRSVLAALFIVASFLFLNVIIIQL